MGPTGGGYQNSPRIYEAIRTHGVENFHYELVLAECETQAQADRMEDAFIDQYDALNPEVGYNVKRAGSHGKHHEETKKKISIALVGREVSQETRDKLSKIHTGLKKPPHTEEWKEQNSVFMIGRHQEMGHPMEGKHHTEEAKAKISEASKSDWDQKHTPESIAKGAAKRRMSPERELAIIHAYQNGATINQIEETFDTGRSSIYRILDRNDVPRSNNFTRWTGKTHTPETREKMSEARSIFWDAKKQNA